MWLFALPIFLLVAERMILPLRIRWFWKVALALPALAAAFKFQLTHLFGGPMFFAPRLPPWIILASAWCYSVIFFLFFLLLFSECVQLIFRLFKRKTPLSVRNRIHLGLLTAAVLLATFGFHQGTAMPQVREVTLTFPNLPENADGVTIALLADLHADAVTRADRIRSIVERTNALHPDVIVIAGDFVDGTVALRGAELEPLRGLSAKYGVFGVPGNHEYYSGYADWISFLSSLGIRMLLNEHETLPNGLVLAGVTDPAARRMGGTPPDPEKALQGVADGTFAVLLSHQPTLADEAAERGVSLQLSGHTHGGMILGLDQFVAKFNGGYVSGLYRVGGMKLYVSNGSGIWNGFPIRIGRNAEITRLKLKSSR